MVERTELSRCTTYGPETPWLCWDAWAKAQRYETPNPPWYRIFTSLSTDPRYRNVREPHGDKAAALLREKHQDLKRNQFHRRATSHD